MKSKITKMCVVFMSVILAFTLNAKASLAGSINSAEQQAINAATSPFEYNQKKYVVNSSYVAQATAKLSADNVDLTEGEAQSYIQQFNSSHQELVEEGYCDELPSGDTDNSKDNKSKGDKSNDNKSDDKTDEKKHTTNESNKNKKFLKLFLGDEKDKIVEKTAEPSTENDAKYSEETAQPSTENDAKYSEKTAQPSSTEPANVWTDEEEEIGITDTIESKDMDYTYDNSIKIKYNGSEYNSGYAFLHEVTHKNDIYILWVVFLLVGIIAVLLQFLYIFKIKKKGDKNRKIRMSISIFSGIAICGITIVVIASLVLRFGYLSKSNIDRELMESDYFSGVAQTAKQMGQQELKVAGYDENIAGEVFTLSNVYITEKQYIEKIVANGKAEISTDKISNLLKEKITTGSKEKNQETIEKLENVYKLALSFKFGDGIYKFINEFKNKFVAIVATSVALLIIMFYVLFKMYSYKHKSVRVFSYAITIGSLMAFVVGFIAKLKYNADSIEVSPIYYKNFIASYVGWNINICIYISAIGVLLGIVLFFVKNYLHKIYVE